MPGRKLIFRKADIRRLSLFVIVVLFFGLNIIGLIFDGLRFKFWIPPVFWTIGVIVYKVLEQSGHFFVENTGSVTHVKLYYLLYIGIIGITLLPVIEFTFFPRDNIVLSVVGLLFLVIGGYLRFVALKTLGECFSTHIEVYQKHMLVDKGLYAVIRHPGYLGSIFLGLGAILSVNAWYSIVFFAGYFIPVLILRIIHEERRLAKELPGYCEYCRKTKRFVPSVF